MPQNSHISQDISFLELPFEIRLMIYELIMISWPAKDKIRSFDYQKDTGIRRSNFINHHCNLPALLTLPGFCTANRQIYYEMKELFRMEPIRLTYRDDLFLDECADTTALACLVQRYPWIHKYTQELRLKVGSNECNSEENGTLLIESKEYRGGYLGSIYSSATTQLMSSSLWGMVSKFLPSRSEYLLPEEPIQPTETTAEFISTFPRLKKIELIWNKLDKSTAWTDFWPDLTAMSATGASCSLVVFEEDDIIDMFRLARKYGGELLIQSTWQYGEHVFCEDHATSKTWRRDGLYSRIRWKSSFRLIAPNGCLSIPVIVEDKETYLD
jgi:hypothetical protein